MLFTCIQNVCFPAVYQLPVFPPFITFLVLCTTVFFMYSSLIFPYLGHYPLLWLSSLISIFCNLLLLFFSICQSLYSTCIPVTASASLYWIYSSSISSMYHLTLSLKIFLCHLMTNSSPSFNAKPKSHDNITWDYNVFQYSDLGITHFLTHVLPLHCAAHRSIGRPPLP